MDVTPTPGQRREPARSSLQLAVTKGAKPVRLNPAPEASRKHRGPLSGRTGARIIQTRRQAGVLDRPELVDRLLRCDKHPLTGVRAPQSASIRNPRCLIGSAACGRADPARRSAVRAQRCAEAAFSEARPKRLMNSKCRVDHAIGETIEPSGRVANLGACEVRASEANDGLRARRLYRTNAASYFSMSRSFPTGVCRNTAYP